MVCDPHTSIGLTSSAAICCAYVSLSVGDHQVQQGKSERVDIMHYHISNKGHLKGLWPGARENYRGIMREPDNVNLLTMMREPREHFIRYVPAARILDLSSRKSLGLRFPSYVP